ncbi:MAG TPA: leucyl aminopeptidase family protein [Acetobacteraceae bacterium]|nr:leucyl aminopeptidase family protein [Acetobacteraceae bacterium]
MLDCLAEDATSALTLHATTPGGLEALRALLPAAARDHLAATGFAAKPQELCLLPGEGGRPGGAVLGLAEGEDGHAPWAFGGAPFALPEGTTWRIEGAPDPAMAVLGWCLGAYRFRRFKSAPGRAAARLVPPPGSEEARIAAEATWRVRDLVNTPASHLGPSELSDAVRLLAEAHGARFEEVSGRALEEGFPAVQAVGGGSPRAPRVAILRWEGAADGPLVALCGKGVCFDTGGLDLKPSSAMLRMKKDMGGAACLIGVAEMLMRLHAPIRLLLLVGAVENAVSGTAFRPLDVIRTRKGLSVEIGNTDAEGRLVLADLLAFAAEHEPSVILDAATLTGAARVALGPDLPALFTEDAGLARALIEAGRAAHDPLWQLPLHKGYAGWLDSPVADLNNVSVKPMAGAIVAALFLQRFIPGTARWAHLDVYAWNDHARPGRPEGGEAQAMRSVAAGILAFLGMHKAYNR